MSPWERLLEKPQPRGHFLQLYQRGDNGSLVRNVSLYVSEGLKRGEGVLIVATDRHRDDFSRELGRLGTDTASAIRENRLVCRDAQETMSRFMVAGQPDWDKFEVAVGGALRDVLPQGEQSRFRAYGEMVGLLWNARQFAAAIRLEQFWNKLLARSSFSLYCAYAVDVFDKKFHPSALDGILCTHTHLVPSESQVHLEAAINLAMDEILGQNADSLRLRFKADNQSSWAVMPKAENIILRLRDTIPAQAEQIIGRAREYYQQSLNLHSRKCCNAHP